MAKFFFNDCLPSNTSLNIEASFHDIISNFLILQKNESLQIDKTIAIGELPGNTTICGVSLKDIISKYQGKREEKKAVMALFSKAIILNHRWDDFVDPDNIYKSFSFNNRDAHYLAIASTNNMIAMSLPIEEQLKNDTLEISVHDTLNQTPAYSLFISNWYKENTDAIRLQLLPKATTQFEILKNLFCGIEKKVIFSKKFEDQWNNNIENHIKDRIIKRFEEANRQNLLFPAIDDPRGPRYKIVRKDKGNTAVFELKLRDIGVRIYFACDTNTLTILLYGTKTKTQGHGQESDFRTANNIFHNMKNVTDH